MNRYSRKYCERDDYDYAGELHEYRSIQVNVSLRDEDVLNNNPRGIKRTRTSTGISTSDLRRNKRPRCDRYEYEDNSRDDIIDDLKRRYKAKERKMDERIERLEGENRKLEAKNSKLLLEQDFNTFFDQEMSDSLCLKVNELEKENTTMSREIAEKSKDLKDKDVVIEDLENSMEKMSREYRQLKKEMERDFLECEFCDLKFRSNEQLKRHSRFDHKMKPPGSIKIEPRVNNEDVKRARSTSPIRDDAEKFTKIK